MKFLHSNIFKPLRSTHKVLCLDSCVHSPREKLYVWTNNEAKSIYGYTNENFVIIEHPCKDKIEFILKENALMRMKMTPIFLFDRNSKMLWNVQIALYRVGIIRESSAQALSTSKLSTSDLWEHVGGLWPLMWHGHHL